MNDTFSQISERLGNLISAQDKLLFDKTFTLQKRSGNVFVFGYDDKSACAAFPYETVRRAIHLFKYDGGKKIGEGLGQLLADYMGKYHAAILAKTDFVLSVPLHPKKEKKRGFNQTHILCEQLSARTGLPFRRDILVRKRETAAQSTLDSSKQRRQNLKNAFAVTEDLTGKQVLLVDDIFTTGATCNECAKELYRAGAQKVFICCLSAAGKLS